MASFNRVVVMGNLGKDPELRHTQNNNAVTTLAVATENYVKDGENTTEWHDIVIWGKQAENAAKYLKKGRSVLVEGRLQTRSYENKEGVKQYKTEIVAQNVQFVGGAKEERRKPDQAPTSLNEIPF